MLHAQPPVSTSFVTPGGEVTLLADRIEQIGPDNLVVATGAVEITSGTARLLADRIEIDRVTGDATARGRVVFYDGENRLTGERVDYNLTTGTGVVYRGEGRAAPYYRLAGERMERLGESVYRVQRGMFTTCEEETPSWSFHFGSATADLDDFVYGSNASFWVKDVPLIPFIPFFAAPIRRERQTGFLPPQIGFSSRKGAFAAVPFYWAISDSTDATMSLDIFERRGFGGSGEYRYVLSRTQRGSVNGSYVYESAQGGDHRGWGAFQHDWLIEPGLSLRADVNGVSDDGVLRVYEDSLSRRAAQRVESNVALTRTWRNWTLSGRLFWYQDLTTTQNVELHRLPELTLEGARQEIPGVPGMLYRVEAGVANFVRELGSSGVRLDLHPQLFRPIPLGGYATVTPFVGGRVTVYDTTVTGVRHVGSEAVETTQDDPRVRRLAEIGGELESRLSRVYDAQGLGGFQAVLHSIEPRVSYVRLFGEDFYGLPHWTTRIDRIPEASWLEYSITSHLRGRVGSGTEGQGTRTDLARLVLGHGYDLQENRLGNVAADLTVNPTAHLRFRGDASYNVEGAGLQTLTSDLAFTVPRVTASIGTSYSKPQVGAGATAGTVPEFVRVPGAYNLGGPEPSRAAVNFLRASARSELTRNVAVAAQTFWDIKSDTFVENRFGVDLRFDCWGLQLEYVDRSREDGGTAEDEFRFTISLRGVGQALSTRIGTGSGSSGARFK